MSQIRMQLLELHPFWGHLLMQVKLLPAPELPTFAATDCVRRIWFNPNQTCQLNLRQLGFVLLHELGHIILLSAQRRMGRNLHLWNCATDFAINRMVAGVRHPATGEVMYESPNGTYPGVGEVQILHDPRWDGLVAETIYERLAGEALPDPVTLTVRLGSDGAVSRIPHVSSHGGGIDIHLPRGLSDEEAEEVTDAVRRAVAAWRCVPRRKGRQPSGGSRVNSTY